MLPANFNAQLIESLIDWLWRSWNSLGVSGHGDPARTDRVIDPESLLLASTVWARYDPRLFDEMLDWLCLYGSLINLQRLRNLHRNGLGDSAVLSAVAAVVQEHSQQTKWKVLIGKHAPSQKPLPLFLSINGKNATWGRPDPLFAAQGFHRGRIELRQMSQAPSPQRAQNLWLKLRGLFGTSTRAEIMLQLLSSGPATAGEIARRSGFTARSILVTLREMAQSGHIYEPPRPARNRPQRGQAPAARTRGPSLAYALRPEEWCFLRTWPEPPGFPTLKFSAPLLHLCQHLLQSLESQKPEMFAHMQSILISEAISGSLKDIQRNGLSGDYGLPPHLPGDSLLPTLAERLPAAIASL
ncbi:MAG: helix-turn-helix transcriptional regulator [Methylacidiphilales bacterium]|nr:helix-turn-helix transcriptional regulator [Candidatus Methylacidiphilales bacterium]